MQKFRHALTGFDIKSFQTCVRSFRLLTRFSSSKTVNVEPTPVAYRAAMLRGASLEELPMRVNFRGKPYKPVSLEESIQYLSSPGNIECFTKIPCYLRISGTLSWETCVVLF